MRQLVHLLCAWGLLAIAALAQQAPPDPATVMDNLNKRMEPMADAWLHSGDPRVQAWGAYVVLRDRRTEAIPELLALVASSPVAGQVSTQADADQHGAMLGVLDALIQFEAQVPAVDAERIYPEFPVQSLILLSRSQDDTAHALMSIFKNEQRSPAAWLAAGNLLLQKQAEGFAAAVVEGMTVHALLMVTSSNSGGGIGGSSFCCMGGGASRPKPGWPPLGVYEFGGCDGNLQPGAMVLAVGTDPAYYYRHVNTTYELSALASCCNPDQDLVRQRYLTKLLVESPEQPLVRAHLSHSIEWQGPDAYLSELAAFIDEQQHSFAELTLRLGERKLLSETEAGTLRPTLQIHVLDLRGSEQPVLPGIGVLPQNTTIGPF